jgi:Putative zincin peptidase
MANPTIEELHNPEHFELIAEMNHNTIKEFVIDQLSEGGKIVIGYMIYQLIMLVLGSFLLIHALIQVFHGSSEALFYVGGALVFSFTLLIPIHELLHGLAIKHTGAPKVHYGAYLKRFIFYAEADRYVINRKQFALIALTPLVTVKLVTLILTIIFLHSPFMLSALMVMATHSFFCAGDIGLYLVFHRNSGSEIFTYDVQAEKKSYYFRKF